MLVESGHNPNNHRVEAIATRPVRIQRRLTSAQVEDLVDRYEEGATIPVLAVDFAIHQTTVSAHLRRRGVPRRVNVRKLAAPEQAEVVRLYESGLSLVSVAGRLGVNASTVMRELHRAGVILRPRR
jgi:hypothetical protein